MDSLGNDPATISTLIERRDADSPPPPPILIDNSESLSLIAPRAFYEDIGFERALRDARLKSGTSASKIG